MTTPVFLAVLAAAFLHAGWNALLRGAGGGRVATVLIMTLVQGMIGLAMVVWRPWPASELWPWLFASGVVHAAYKLFLTYAYERGDLSRVYPIARGAAPMMVLVFGGIWLSDTVAPVEYIGIIVIGLGLALMARGVFTSGESRRMLPFAVASALATASYSVIDGLGARIAADAQLFVGWMFFLDALFLSAAIGLTHRAAPFRAMGPVFLRGSLAAALSYAAYAIVVWAMTVAPIALVTALRESSILFAVLIGWLWFGERMDKAKAAAVLAIVTGIVLTRLA